MTKNEIVARAKDIKTVEDLANLLNEIKEGEFKTKKYPISSKQLKHFCNPQICDKRYRTFLIRKKSGGTREINAPYYQMGLLLRIINILFKSLYTPSDSAMGFAEGRSVVKNASMHVGHHYVLDLDLQNFFPSIPQRRVWARLQIPPFNFTPEIASVIAGICCAPDEERKENVLPQGSPTSPLLTNAICDRLDHRMRGVAKRFGLHYSRYADDMTFSSMHNVYQKDGEFMKEVKRIIQVEGFTMNDKKTRLLRDGQRQEVTGLTVNSCVNVTRKYIRDLRRYIYLWEKNGYAKAYCFFYKHYKQEKGYIKKGEPVMENVISGKLNYLRMVKGDHNEAYQKLQHRFDALQQVVYVDNETDKDKQYIYVQPYTLSNFEELFQTKISLAFNDKEKLVGKCDIAGFEKTLAISKSTQAFIKEKLGQLKLEDIPSANFFQSFNVTLCRKKGKNFWLITQFEPKRSYCLSLQDARVDIDRLLAIWEYDGIEAAANALDQNLKGINAIEQYVFKKKAAKKSSEESETLYSLFGDDANFANVAEDDIDYNTSNKDSLILSSKDIEENGLDELSWDDFVIPVESGIDEEELIRQANALSELDNPARVVSPKKSKKDQEINLDEFKDAAKILSTL